MLNVNIEDFVRKTSQKDLAKRIDHTMLKPNAGLEQLERVCHEALKYGFVACVVPPWFVEKAKSIVGDSVKVVTVIGFPHGNTTKRAKLAEARDVLEKGAREIDMVMNINAFKSELYEIVESEIAEIVDIAREYNALVKVIIETAYLTDEGKIKAALISKKAGADYVKTSTGFAGRGATIHDVILLKKAVGDSMKVKAAGGIRHLEDAVAMILAGADRIGTSSGVQIMEEYLKLRKSLK
ncbi:MAG: deoxyribose-phosphate aldolase [Thermoprotei archaeon]|nr:MAG: deoxyribose-phosphate aldolase [Thermoprotei archaeon]